MYIENNQTIIQIAYIEFSKMPFLEQ